MDEPAVRAWTTPSSPPAKLQPHFVCSAGKGCLVCERAELKQKEDLKEWAAIQKRSEEHCANKTSPCFLTINSSNWSTVWANRGKQKSIEVPKGSHYEFDQK